MLIAGAIALAEPERMFTLTLVGEDWQTARARYNDFAGDVRSLGYVWNACIHVEPNPRGTGRHVHGLQWGSWVPQRLLSKLADGAGMGRVVDIRPVRGTLQASHYGLKLAAAAYGVKMADGELETYLEANGGRLVHSSRGFWRDGPGRPIRGIRGAVQTAVRRTYGESDSHRWTLITHGAARARGLVA